MPGKVQKSGLTEIIPFLCTSAFHILSFLRAHHGGVAAVWWLLKGRHSLPF